MQNFKTKLIGKNLSIQIISISEKDTKGKIGKIKNYDLN